jgi:hypothetical protein
MLPLLLRCCSTRTFLLLPLLQLLVALLCCCLPRIDKLHCATPRAQRTRLMKAGCNSNKPDDFKMLNVHGSCARMIV